LEAHFLTYPNIFISKRFGEIKTHKEKEYGMEYISMPKITEKQHARFLKLIRFFEGAGGNEDKTLLELSEWLKKGSLRTISKKNNPGDLLTKFTDKEKGHNYSEYLCRIHDINGTRFACSRKIAAVILPEILPEWELKDACVLKSDGSLYLSLQNIFNDCRNFDKIVVSEAGIEKLLAACIAQKETHKELVKKDKAFKKLPTLVDISANRIEAVSEEEADNISKNGEDRVITFDVDLLEPVLRFILCARADVEVFRSFSKKNGPVAFHTGNLYTLILPYFRKTAKAGSAGKKED
jgi:hypothetical protein